MIDAILNFFSTKRRIRSRQRAPGHMRQQLFGTAHTSGTHPLGNNFIASADREDTPESHERTRKT